MKILPVQNIDTLLTQKGSNKKESPVIEKESVENKVIDYRVLSNEELIGLHYANKATNTMKSLIEIYLEVEEQESSLSYEDIRDIQKYQNRNQILEKYNDYVKIQNEDLKYEKWV